MELTSLFESSSIAPVPGGELEEALEAHDAIFPALASLASRRRSDEDLDRIDDALRAMSDATDATTFAAGTRRLECAIADAAANRLLASGLALLQQGAGEALALRHGTETADLLHLYAQLADAILQRDPERASRSASEIARCLRTAAPLAPPAPVNQPPASLHAALRRGDRP